MNKNKYFTPIFFLFVLNIASCIGQRRSALVPVPDTDFFDFSLPVQMNNIVDSRNGPNTNSLPLWLQAYINGGIEEVEKLSAFENKYVFIGMSEGQNFVAMEKWSENFSPVRDTTILAAGRIEKKLITAASLYPDDEYGAFFEVITREAYSVVYPGAEKEDSYWIRMRTEDAVNSPEIFVYFVLITIDKTAMQYQVQDMIKNSIPSSQLTRNQRNAINNLQQNFFEGF